MIPLLVLVLISGRIVVTEVMPNPAGSSGAREPEDRNEFVELHNLSDAANAEEESAFTKVRRALSKLAAATPRYQCQECGFSKQCGDA